ncbi:hypothetical protein A33Q_1652 [Indibacter alkaliphilus LW1]|uniref:Uncharacterized protein n=1 Tax=Indibacter alkaliphilus (strain CCUG 57479 / KCTC 22604 / LW1) TaxID=1189612 RepID=S2E6D9_INDAL|nr:hypothetical protein A33Q_1652 [Indibacter alkaliphilus LW1]
MVGDWSYTFCLDAKNNKKIKNSEFPKKSGQALSAGYFKHKKTESA